MNKTLPYYLISKTEEDRQFFYSHEGYFNFWDEYLIMNIKEGYNKVFTVLVNRPDRKFGKLEIITEDYKAIRDLHIVNSVCSRKPKDMFIDFPELRKFDFYERRRINKYGNF